MCHFYFLCETMKILLHSLQMYYLAKSTTLSIVIQLMVHHSEEVMIFISLITLIITEILTASSIHIKYLLVREQAMLFWLVVIILHLPKLRCSCSGVNSSEDMLLSQKADRQLPERLWLAVIRASHDKESRNKRRPDKMD